MKQGTVRLLDKNNRGIFGMKENDNPSFHVTNNVSLISLDTSNVIDVF